MKGRTSSGNGKVDRQDPACECRQHLFKPGPQDEPFCGVTALDKEYAYLKLFDCGY